MALLLLMTGLEGSVDEVARKKLESNRAVVSAQRANSWCPGGGSVW